MAIHDTLIIDEEQIALTEIAASSANETVQDTVSRVLPHSKTEAFITGLKACLTALAEDAAMLTTTWHLIWHN